MIHHADHGSQSTATAVSTGCRAAEIRCSMGSIGDCYDHAVAESFFATVECERLRRETFRTHAQARAALFDYSACFYKRRRRHSALAYLSPQAYARRYTHQQQVA